MTDAKTQGLPEMISLIALAVIGYDCPTDELDAEHLFLKDRRQLDKLIPLIREELLGSEILQAAAAVITLWDAPIAGVTGQEDPNYGAPMSRLRAELNALKGQTP